jgi:hypothetical protein
MPSFMSRSFSVFSDTEIHRLPPDGAALNFDELNPLLYNSEQNLHLLSDRRSKNGFLVTIHRFQIPTPLSSPADSNANG